MWTSIRDNIITVMISGVLSFALGMIGAKLSPALDKLSDKVAAFFKKIDDPLPDGIETVVDATIDKMEAVFDASVSATMETLPALITAAGADGKYTLAEVKTIISALGDNFKTKVATSASSEIKTGIAAIWNAAEDYVTETFLGKLVTKIKSFFAGIWAKITKKS